MEYQDFDIRIEKGDDGLLLIATSMNFGEARDKLSIDLVSSEFQSDLERLAARQTDQGYLNRFGVRLYDNIFKGDIDRIFQRSFGETQSRAGAGIRLRLRIQVPEIATLPWEFLYSSIDRCYLGTQVSCPLIRYLDLPIPDRSFKVSLPVKILVAVPGKLEGYPEINAETEIRNLNHALEGISGNVYLKILDKHVTWSKISDALMDDAYHCFHFIGHGLFQNEKGYLLLNAPNQSIDCVDEEKFAGLFRNHPTMKLVMLNSCQGATVSSTKPLVGMAPQLVRLGIPAVVAMQYPVYDDIAVVFARDFYRSLFRGKNKGRVEVAMSQARNTLATRYPEERDLATPVLFMRSKTGVLFEAVTGSLIKDTPFLKQSLDTARATAETYVINADLLNNEQERSPDPARAKELTKTGEALTNLKKRIFLGNLAFVSALILAVVFFFLAWMNLFDVLTLDTRLETLIIWSGDRLATKTFNEKIVMVAIDNKSEESLGEYGISWRRNHAKLIEVLAQAGARVVVLDFFFEENSPSDDPLLLDAIKRAQDDGRRTSIVVGFKRLKENCEPYLFDGLETAVKGTGLACFGKRLKDVKTAYLAVSNNEEKPFASVALATYSLYHGFKFDGVDWQNHRINFSSAKDPGLKTHEFSEWRDAHEDQPNCGAVLKSTRIADLYIDLTPRETITDTQRRFSYVDVLNSTDPNRLKYFKDKIVIVGLENQTVRVVGGQRYGYQLLADTLSALMQGITIRPLRAGGQFMVLLAIALLGAFIRLLTTPRGRLWQLLQLIVLPVVFLVIAIYSYIQYHLILNAGYHIVAFLLTYWVTGKVKRRWFV